MASLPKMLNKQQLLSAVNHGVEKDAEAECGLSNAKPCLGCWEASTVKGGTAGQVYVC